MNDSVRIHQSPESFGEQTEETKLFSQTVKTPAKKRPIPANHLFDTNGQNQTTLFLPIEVNPTSERQESESSNLQLEGQITP